MVQHETAVEYSALPRHHQATHNEKLVITASSLGTVFEWYDFYLYGLLTSIIAAQFLTGLNPTTSFIMALLVFAAGFIVRPFGALVFGRIGDMFGRRYTFIITLLVMGLSTFLVGCLPTYKTAGVAAPIMLVVLRMFQGLALGGEYGGAATYVAEHAPNNKRGLYTSWIQITATAGLAMALLIVILVRSPATGVGEEAFKDWGWRIPYLISGLFLAVGLWLRLKLHESPVFQKMKNEGTASKAPLSDAFGQWSNLKFVMIAFFGAIAGQAVVWYTGQLYALFFLEKMLKIDGLTANNLAITALLLGAPFFLVFGWLSDKIGRKPIILGGCALAALTLFPTFHALTNAANPALAKALASAPVTVTANPAECSSQFDPVGKNPFDTTSCDIIKNALAKSGVNYTNVTASAGTIASVTVGGTTIAAPDPSKITGDDRKKAIAAFTAQVVGAPAVAAAPAQGDKPAVEAKPAVVGELSKVGYPSKADPAQINKPLVVALLFYLVLLVTMVYGPIAAMLVELFPSRIRYTSMSLPYHIGNGWLGGLLPAIGFAMVASNGDIYFGFWYPVVVAAATVVIGLIFLPETFRRNIDT
ncbi:Sugar transporter [Novosphingobium sp. CF614]|uniref:MFS transporter n=1 Tax=Novosphingobium sp. CF614 TaxID=1884364 RepID=UPI0008ECEAAD|nr:MFS transporter [Novosphingobium sp. CF614]SFG50118.1 Sugar transporter [Novosphingobium sp. CF614]